MQLYLAFSDIRNCLEMHPIALLYHVNVLLTVRASIHRCS